MLRYLRLYAYFVRFSISRNMEFRMDFFFRIFMDLVYYGVNLTFFQLVFLHTNLLGGWNAQQMFIFVAGYLTVDALHMTFFSNNVWWLPVLVNKGDLDYYLTRPVSSFFFLNLRDFAANSCINLIFALGIMCWAIFSYPGHFGVTSVLAYFFAIGLGAILYFMVHLLTILPVFWLESAKTLHQIFYNTTRFMERPDRIYQGFTRKVLIFAVPFALMASFPARILLEPFDIWILGQFLGVILLFMGIVFIVWRAGLRVYSSASS